MKRVNMKIAAYIFSCMMLAGLSSCGDNANSSNGTDSTANNMGNTGQDIEGTANNMGEQMKGGADTLAGRINSAFKGNNPDSSFLVEAGTHNEDEMRLLQAGIDKGTSQELKAHAKMMLADHKKMGQEVKAYASKNKYAAMDNSDSKASDELKDINSKAVGKDWDKAWTDQLEKSHKETIDLFEKGQSNVKDAVLNGMITKTLPKLKSHLTMMESLQTSLK